jgi:hypothetical protein
VNLDPAVWGTVFPELLDPPPPTRTRPILGFRINRIQIVQDAHRSSRLFLMGFGPRTYFWEPGKNVATCSRPGIGTFRPAIHRAPATGCWCGLYACHHLAETRWAGSHASEPVVLAAVAGTGIVRIHTRGWRAQFARIVAFSDELPELTAGRFFGRAKMRGRKVIGSDLARALEEKYEVPVVPLAKLAEVIRAAGDFFEGEK